MDKSLPLMAITNRVHFAIYCVAAGITALAGSLFLVGITWLIANKFGYDPLGSSESTEEALSWLDAFGFIIFAPVVETFLLILLLKLLARHGLTPIQSCFASCVLWALGHALIHPMAFVGTILSFFLFGWGYLAWRSKSGAYGFWAAAIPHAIVNSAVVSVGMLASGT